MYEYLTKYMSYENYFDLFLSDHCVYRFQVPMGSSLSCGSVVVPMYVLEVVGIQARRYELCIVIYYIMCVSIILTTLNIYRLFDLA
jgi:hypothetical protein